MHINISGQHIDLGDSLRTHVEERLQKSVHKFFEKAVSSEVHFVKHNHNFHCNILVNEGTKQHLVIKGESESDDAYTAFDQALIKIEKQLRKYKDKIKNHHKKSLTDLDSTEIRKLGGTKYTIERPQEETEHPLVIAEKATIIQHLTVAEAVMLMDLADLPAMVFINKANDRINFIYHRKDGNISWVDPENH
ncbi:MAG: ribosome-associated translation inhibitor RaiA [Alphaproteobacteria bacterium]|nr:ribosome-associated translation inhibitor RaiA [Alphaproteobacteria bacterium]OJV14102.1 MAG: ribosomal subunit interface protein [Alphaproteobacteria bacterium 33-17]